MGRPASCHCGWCRRCKARIAARAKYQSMSPEERRAIVARRDPAKVRAADRARYERDKAKRLALSKKWAAENAERARALRAAWIERNPEKRRAHIAVGNAIRDGRLVRQPCEVAGCGDIAQAHHDDYSRPLDVRWLCASHHAAHHKSLRRAA